MQTKICARCGIEKPIEEFRKYYGGRKGRYTYCKECERIEQRRKNLIKKPTLTPEQQIELDKIERLYKLRASQGLSIPGNSDKPTTLSLVEQHLKSQA